jgi:exopolysaccharide biosynthesis polyprenyl glycosylphosphotransferase
MGPTTPLQNTMNNTINIKLVESVARNKNKYLKTKFTLNVLLIGIEYFLYFISFLLFYQWRVVPEFSLVHPQLWLKDAWFREYLFLISIIFTIYTIILVDKGIFKLHVKVSIFDYIINIMKATFISFMIAIGIIFLMKTSLIYSRVVLVGYALSIIFISMIVAVLKNFVILLLANTNRFTRNILIVGAGKVGEEVESSFSKFKTFGYKVIGFLDDNKVGSKVLGRINELEQIIESNRVDEIYITIPSERHLINKLLSTVRKYDVDIKVIPELYDFVSSSIKMQQSAALPYMEIVKTPLKGLNLFFKRSADIILSTIGLIIVAPIMLIIILLIKLDSPGPVFFKQKRIGKNGVPFNMYKFRSMVTDAESLLKQLQQQNEADGPVFKIKNDPRVTKIGRILRKYSLDELPQLLNVLLGTMSLIGPRPPLPKEVEKYDNYQWRRLNITPGITGLWQVSGRSDLNFEEWVKLDIYYIENWSISMDVKILLRTIPVVIMGKGAY